MNRFKKFILNGLLLSAVSLIMRFVGVSYNVYISNRVGAEAMGLFTLISTVYGFGITLATSGVNLASTRLVSEAIGKKSSDKIRTILIKCVLYSLFFSLLSAAILYLGAERISIIFLKDERCISSLKILAFSLPSISLSSALSGYFSAVRKVYKNAVVQMIEQGAKIFLCSALLTFFFAGDVETACVCIVLGGTVAEILSFLVQLAMYFLDPSKGNKQPQENTERKSISRDLRRIALPVAFSAYLRSGLITIEHILIPIGLEKSGASRERSLAAYGTVHSMVFPIVLFPSAILSSFAGLLVPEISEAKARGDLKEIERIISNVLEVSLFFAIGTAGIMLFFSFELGNVIYPQTHAGKYIRMIAPLIPVMYLDTAVDAILKGLGEQVYSMWVNIIDSSLSVLLVIILLPLFGIDGYIITVYFTELINAAMSITRLISVSKIRPSLYRNVFIPLFSVIISAVAVNLFSTLSLFDLFPSYLSLTLHIAATAAIYLALAFTLGAIRSSKLKKAIKLIGSEK